MDTSKAIFNDNLPTSPTNLFGDIVVQIIEVTDPLDARRAKYAQYSGLHKTLSLNGQIVNGLVRSVTEDMVASPAKWIVSIIPTPIRHSVRQPKVKTARWR